jgi:galactose-6-phosphate isomerase
MPSLDVTDILTDPDFADTFNVTRSIQTISPGGMASNSSILIANVSGVVTANDDIDLLKMPDGELLSGSITIITKFRLTNGSGAIDADVVTWHGRTYQVKTIGDWSGWGAGFIEAICTLNVVSP